MTKNKKEKTLSQTPPAKEFTIRCPRLGHEIYFQYCQGENMGKPCFKTLDCWHHHFNVHAFLKEKLTNEDFEKIFVKQSQPKIFSLLDLIEQAKKEKGPKRNKGTD